MGPATPPMAPSDRRTRPAIPGLGELFPIGLDLTLFDGSAPTVTGALARLLRSAEGRGTVVVVLPGSGRGPSLEPALRSAAFGTRTRMLWLDTDPGVESDPAASAPLEGAVRWPVEPAEGAPRAEAGVGRRAVASGFAQAVASFETMPFAVAPGGVRPGLVVGPGSLLDSDRWAASTAPAESVPAVLTDPFVAGRFDGSGLRQWGGTPGRPPRPGDLKDRQEWLRPVLPFGFLAEARRRTLAQAVLQYLLELDGVAVVAIPAGSAEVVEEALALDRVPPLDVARRARVPSAAAEVRGDRPSGSGS